MTNLKRNRYSDSTSFLTENKIMFLIISGSLGLISQTFKSLRSINHESEFINLMQFMTIIFGFLYFYVLAKENKTKRSRDEFKEYIDNKRNIQALLNYIFQEQFISSNLLISEIEYQNAIKKWHSSSDETNRLRNLYKVKQNLQSFIDDIGFEDFSILLLNKAENLNLINVTKQSGELFYKFNL